MTDERATLAEILAYDWYELSAEGDEIDGFITVDVAGNGARRWTENMTVITKTPSGRYLRWSYEQGLTEAQDNEYSGTEKDLEEVTLTEKPVSTIVRIWQTI